MFAWINKAFPPHERACSFCKNVKKPLVEASGGVFICQECAESALEAFRQETIRLLSPKAEPGRK